MYEELKALLKSRYMDTKKMLPCELEHEAADTIEQLERQLDERDAELQKYRDAPVVAYKWTLRRDGFVQYTEKFNKADDFPGWDVLPLIVKPGEQ